MSDCASCKTAGRKGYCALGRCYCAHETCPAFASFVPLSALSTDAPVKPNPRVRSSWDDREESTWIDQL